MKIKRVAIIPARGDSKRIKKKNIRKFYKSSLLEITINFAKNLDFFTDIVVSSDNINILKIASKFKLIKIHKRNKKLSSDQAKINDLIKFLLKNNYSQYDFAYLLEPTSVIRKKTELIKQMHHFEKINADSFGSCNLSHIHPQKLFSIKNDGKINGLNKNGLVKRSQDLGKLFQFNGLIYGINIQTYLKEKPNHNIFGKAYAFISSDTAIDINTMNDFKNAEILFKYT